MKLDKMSAGESRTLRVEFFGIPRLRAGVADAVIPLPDAEIELGQLLTLLAEKFPRLSPECVANGAMRQGFTANIDGRRFVSRPEERIQAGETVLILSADAGG